jgi:hypothetical protein
MLSSEHPQQLVSETEKRISDFAHTFLARRRRSTSTPAAPTAAAWRAACPGFHLPRTCIHIGFQSRRDTSRADLRVLPKALLEHAAQKNKRSSTQHHRDICMYTYRPYIPTCHTYTACGCAALQTRGCPRQNNQQPAVIQGAENRVLLCKSEMCGSTPLVVPGECRAFRVEKGKALAP